MNSCTFFILVLYFKISSGDILPWVEYKQIISWKNNLPESSYTQFKICVQVNFFSGHISKYFQLINWVNVNIFIKKTLWNIFIALHFLGHALSIFFVHVFILLLFQFLDDLEMFYSHFVMFKFLFLSLKVHSLNFVSILGLLFSKLKVYFRPVLN